LQKSLGFKGQLLRYGKLFTGYFIADINVHCSSLGIDKFTIFWNFAEEEILYTKVSMDASVAAAQFQIEMFVPSVIAYPCFCVTCRSNVYKFT